MKTRHYARIISFLLIVVGVSITMGLVALVQLTRQKRLIQLNLSEAQTDPLTVFAGDSDGYKVR